MAFDPNYVPPLKGRGSKLTPKQMSFIDEYMVDLNGTDAVIRSAYKSKAPTLMAIELLRHPLVRAEIDKRLQKRREKTELSAEYVIQKLIKIVENTDEENPTAALRGLELLGKTLAMFKERQEISGPDGGAIETAQRVKEDVHDFTSRISRLAKRAGEAAVSQFPEPGSSSKS